MSAIKETRKREEILAQRIPKEIRDLIKKESIIEKANVNSYYKNTAMEFLFNVYEDYLDINGEYDSITCPQCRNHILNDFKKIKPYL